MKKLATLFLLTLLITISVQAEDLEAPAEGKARIYFFNYGGTLIGRYPISVFKDKEYLGNVRSSAYYPIDVDPGNCVLWAKTANKKWFMKADVEAGKTYFIHIQTIPGKGFNPVPSPMLHNASQNFKKGKKSYKGIMKRLAKGKFTLENENTAERIAENGATLQGDIQEVWQMWESKWSKAKKWNKIVISPADGF